MSVGRLIQLTLIPVLWYFFAGLVFTRALHLWPQGFEREGFFLVSAALPWSLLTLGFYQGTDSIVGAAVRDLLFLGVIAAGIAMNVALIYRVIGLLGSRARLRLRIRRLQTARDASNVRPNAPLR